MLIIFDLDDTLIDTSGCITSVKLEDALLRMVEAGFVLPDFSAGLKMLQRINSSSPNSRSALTEFLEIHGGERRFLEHGLKELSASLPEDFPLFPLEGALNLLAELHAFHQLALVTVGKREFQFEKMKKAGVDSSLFSKIIVCEEPNKGPHYQAVAEELGFSPSGVVVCGDRIPIDLTPAKELGFKTVHIPWGRGKNRAGAKCDVDFTVFKLSDITEIIAALRE